MSLRKLSLAGNNGSVHGQGEFVSDIPAVGGKIVQLFLQCRLYFMPRLLHAYTHPLTPGGKFYTHNLSIAKQKKN
jgi:hypothetical protein